MSKGEYEVLKSQVKRYRTPKLGEDGERCCFWIPITHKAAVIAVAKENTKRTGGKVTMADVMREIVRVWYET